MDRLIENQTYQGEKLLWNYRIFETTYVFANLSFVCVDTLRPRQNGRQIPDDNFKCMFWMKIYKLRLRFHLNLVSRVQLTIFRHWFRYWLGAGKATNYYLNQWWIVHWRIYASLSINEVSDFPICFGIVWDILNAQEWFMRLFILPLTLNPSNPSPICIGNSNTKCHWTMGFSIPHSDLAVATIFMISNELHSVRAWFSNINVIHIAKLLTIQKHNALPQI